MEMRKKLYLLVLALCTVAGARAQRVGIKTNLLYDATATVNAGIEFGLSTRWTLDVSGNLNAWEINRHFWKHWMVQPEARYWFCERFAGNFLGFHAIGGEFNIGNIKNGIRFLGSDFSKLTDRRYQGWAAGAGVAYGHAWVLGNHWNFEAEIGVGWVYTRYDIFPCAACGKKLDSDRDHHYFGPTKAALNLVYLF